MADATSIPVIAAVAPTPEPDTVSALEFLLAQARAGEVIGLAWIALHPADGYDVDLAGHAKNIPVFVRGLLPVLDDQLAKIIGSK